MKYQVIFCAFIVLLAAGCATDIGPAARKAGVNTIKVEPRIDVDLPMRIGFKDEGGNLSVALANMLVNEMYSKRLMQLSSNMQQNAINVPDMVRDGTATMLREEKGFTVVTNGGDAVLVVAIRQYGFDGSGFSLSKEVPFIVLRAELTRRGERVWRGQGQAHPMRAGGLGARLEEYQTQPDLLRQHWEKQVERALRELFMAKDGK
ncbi:MAG TPA: hypothetical protein VGF13_01765 [Verrucomicrobiae bacterium]